MELAAKQNRKKKKLEKKKWDRFNCRLHDSRYVDICRLIKLKARKTTDAIQF